MNLNSITSVASLSVNQSDNYKNGSADSDENVFHQLLQNTEVTKNSQRNTKYDNESNRQQTIDDDSQINASTILPYTQLPSSINFTNQTQELLQQQYLDEGNEHKLILDADGQLIETHLLALNETEQKEVINANIVIDESSKIFDNHEQQQAIINGNKQSIPPSLLTKTSSEILNLGDQSNVSKFNKYAINLGQHNDAVFNELTSNNAFFNQLSPQMSGQNQSISTSHSTTVVSLPVTVDEPQWQASISEQIIMFKRQHIEKAEIRLNPAELGSLHIKLSMNDGKMQLHMAAAVEVVKGILESALPYLRTSLADQGIELQQTEVTNFASMTDNDSSSQFQQDKHDSVDTLLTDDELPLQTSSLSSVSLGGLSVFA